MSVPIGYEEIKALAEQTGSNINDLIALARSNDPFFIGTPAHIRDAEWFVTWWHNLGFTDKVGVHLRAIHYKLVSQAIPPEIPSGKPYINTKECWAYLGVASKMARHLGLVPIDAFEDHRNPDPVLCALVQGDSQPALESDEWEEWKLPEIKIELGDFELPLPQFYATGYDYSPSHQPYHLEIWIEKSTMDKVLLPICQRYGVNLVLQPT